MGEQNKCQGFPCRSGGSSTPPPYGEGPVYPCDGSPDNSCGCRDSNATNTMLENVHRRNINTMASPVIILFDGFHNILYQIFLASRYLLSLVMLLVRSTLEEIIKPRPTDIETSEEVSTSCSKPETNIIVNRLAASVEKSAAHIATSYRTEAENYAVQHQVNKLKQHHRRAFDLISRALTIDEESASKDTRTVEMYKKGIQELERGILMDFKDDDLKEHQQARKLQHKMKLNLDMAKKRLDWHTLNATRKSQPVLKHLSLPRSCKAPTSASHQNVNKVNRREKSTYTPPPTRRIHHKDCVPQAVNSETLPRNYKLRRSSSTASNRLSKDTKFMQIIMDEIIEQSPSCSFEMVAGQLAAKQALQETVILPALRPELFTGLRTPTRGLLLFGPPGNGKTMLARAVASESDSSFFNISASTLTSKYVGEGEKLVRALFTAGRQMQPSIIFIDEIDSLLCERSEGEHEASRRLKTEFLLEFDGLRGQADDRILVMGATNRPQDLDEAVLRRFSKRIYVRLPSRPDRVMLIQKLLAKQYNELTEHEVHQIAQLTGGYSGSDLASLARDAAYGPIRELEIDEVKSLDPVNLRKVNMSDFLESMKKMKKSVSGDTLIGYEAWNQKFGESAP